jgi:hypothetical protein
LKISDRYLLALALQVAVDFKPGILQATLGSETSPRKQACQLGQVRRAGNTLRWLPTTAGHAKSGTNPPRSSHGLRSGFVPAIALPAVGSAESKLRRAINKDENAHLAGRFARARRKDR